MPRASKRHVDSRGGSARALYVLILLATTSAGCEGGKTNPTSGAPAHAPTTSATPSAGSGAKTVVTFAAASTADVLEAVAKAFEETSGIRVEFNCASSGQLAQQILKGGPAEVFLSASVEWAERLAHQGLIAEQVPLLTNKLVVIVPRDSALQVNSPADLVQSALTSLALGDPETTPAGQYARKSLSERQLWSALEPRLVAGADVREALAYVERGEAEAGIVYATDAALSKRVRVACELPPASGESIVYPLALLKSAEGNPAAREWYTWLRGPQAESIFKAHGFGVLPASPKDK